MLVKPSHPGNVGAVARAMRTMGLRRLVLVAPHEPAVCEHPEAIARASGAADILAAAQVVGSLDEALAPFGLAVAISAAGREFGPQPAPPETVVAAVRAELLAVPGTRAAFVFGTERTGLTVDEAARCQLLCSIPGEADYNSLNLAQAAQIVAYCLRALDRLQPLAPPSDTAIDSVPADGRGVPASMAAVEGLFGHLEQALVAIGFLDPAHPKRLMPRLRRLFGRTRLEAEEVALLRGVCTQILKLADGDIHGPARRDGPDSAARRRGPGGNGAQP